MIHEIVIYGVLYSNSTNTVFAGSFAFNSKFSDSEPTETQESSEESSEEEKNEE